MVGGDEGVVRSKNKQNPKFYLNLNYKHKKNQVAIFIIVINTKIPGFLPIVHCTLQLVDIKLRR